MLSSLKMRRKTKGDAFNTTTEVRSDEVMVLSSSMSRHHYGKFEHFLVGS